MKKHYSSPELDLMKFSFEQMLDEGSHLIHSNPQGYGDDGGGNGDGEFGG